MLDIRAAILMQEELRSLQDVAPKFDSSSLFLGWLSKAQIFLD
jgi:hypothetical protein